MRVMLTSADFGIGYELFPVNKRIAAKFERATGTVSVLFQSDWDFPSLAESLGWNSLTAHKRGCSDPGSTDGTITCLGCGRTASYFIVSAQEWLDKHCGVAMQPRGIEVYFEAA